MHVSTPKLAIITVTYSPGEYLRQFLDSILAGTEQPVRVILADNGSTDGAPEAAAQHYAGHPRMSVEFMPTGGNIGYGPAINKAAELLAQDDSLRPDFLLISNPDVVFAPGAIDDLIAAGQRLPKAGALGPLIRENDGNVYPSARSVPQIKNGIAHAILGPIWKNNPWTKSYLDDADMSHERPAGWLSGACLLVRWDAFKEVNGFDEGYFMYMEDVDLGDRLGRAGWQNIFVPTAEIRHAQGHSADSCPEITVVAHHRSAYKFQADRHPDWYAAPLRWILRAGLWLRCRIALNRARRKATTK